MIFLEAKQGIARKLNIDLTNIAVNGLFSADDITDYANQGAMKAWDLHFWDFAEVARTLTLVSGDITNGYIAYPNDIQSSSIFLAIFNAKQFAKKNFQDFKKYFEDYPTATDKYWSEYKRLVFFNTNAVSAGQLVDVYGKRNFSELSSDNDLMPFSPDTDSNGYSGNQACVLLGYAQALRSDKLKDYAGAEAVEKEAYGILEILWNQFAQGRSIEQSKNRPMFDIPDYFRNGNSGGGNNVGTFNN